MAGTTVEEDLRYARQLAQQGAHAPLLGGSLSVWWGALVSLAYLLHHFALAGRFGEGGAAFPVIWIGFGIIGGAGQFLLSRGLREKSGAGSAANLAAGPVWMAAVFAIASMVAGCVIAAQRGAGPATFDWIVPVAFATYACALIVTGSLSANRVVQMAGGGAIVMVGLFTAFILSPDRYLIASAGVALTVLLPGILLVRAQPK